MKLIQLRPKASLLLASIRSVGYDAAAAVADILDNSVTAGAKRIQIRFDPGAPTAVGIIDDGVGMTRDELVQAMTYGSRGPDEERAANDLGRFGLGLKTASISQCRRLTVVSRRDGHAVGMVWDLDTVDETGDWSVGRLSATEVRQVPFWPLLAQQGSGTLVVWEKLDRLAADDPGDGSLLSDRMKTVADHLSLVFHRFMSDRRPLVIEVNGNRLEPLDPFLDGKGSHAEPEETIRVGGDQVVVRAYTLPHVSNLTKAQVAKAGLDQTLRRQQGFYVYRARRLIVWGTWFRMHRQEELTKLTRVRVDVPTSLDHLWSLDIKKSAAVPPEAVKERLRGLVPTMTKPSRATHVYRGRKTTSPDRVVMWDRIEDRDGVRYEVSRTHPLVAGLLGALEPGLASDFGTLLKSLAVSLPLDAIQVDLASDKAGHKRVQDEDELLAFLEDTARTMLAHFDHQPEVRARLIEGLALCEPFSMHASLLPKLRKKLS
ncbi:MAG: ATP-binding protein [Burkholderiales bacterium]|nr:ATP-binding protein [Burkholderiales bacterium]